MLPFSQTVARLCVYGASLLPAQIFVPLSDEEVRTNQYSYTHHARVLEFERGDRGVPGVFINYDLSPIMVCVCCLNKRLRLGGFFRTVFFSNTRSTRLLIAFLMVHVSFALCVLFDSVVQYAFCSFNNYLSNGALMTFLMMRVSFALCPTELALALLFGANPLAPAVQIRITETRRSFLHFLTGVCAIVGGVFTVASLVDAALYHSQRAFQRKMEMGKGS